MDILICDINEERSANLREQLKELTIFKTFKCDGKSSLTEVIENNPSTDVVFLYICTDSSKHIEFINDIRNHKDPTIRKKTIICYTEVLSSQVKSDLQKAGADNLISLFMPPKILALTVRSTINPLNTLSGLKALVVDDSVLSRKLVSSALKLNGIEVYEAKNGDEAISYLDDNSHEVSIIFLDDNMPGMSGRDIANHIRKVLGLTDIIIIFIAAASDDLTSEDFYGVGAADYIVKPLRKKELMSKVYTHLSRKILVDHMEVALTSVTKVEKERRDLIQICAHDILTPLTSIMGLTEIVAESEAEDIETIKKDAKSIHDACKHIWEATNKILKNHQ